MSLTAQCTANLRSLGSQKKRTPQYLERDDIEREAFLEKVQKIPEGSIVFIDETGISDNEIPACAWSYSGVRAPGPTRGRSHKRVSIVASLKRGKLSSAMVLDGAFNGDAFEAYISQVLLPKCVPGDVVIMDNAQIHKSPRIREILKTKQCELLYQPKYSPDLNPIEHQWSPLKAEIRRSIEKDIAMNFCIFEKASEILKLRLA